MHVSALKKKKKNLDLLCVPQMAAELAEGQISLFTIVFVHDTPCMLLVNYQFSSLSFRA